MVCAFAGWRLLQRTLWLEDILYFAFLYIGTSSIVLKLAYFGSCLQGLLLFTWLMREMQRMQFVALIGLNLAERAADFVLSGQRQHIASDNIFFLC